MLKRAQTNNWIKGFNVNCRADSNMMISHLQYADDTLVFWEADREQLKVLRVIFIHFEAISGLHINWHKSYIYPVNEVMELQSLADILGGNVGELPAVYLGMPLGAKSKSKEIWNGVLEKCEKKLANWKNQYLSRGQETGGLGIKNLRAQNHSLMMKWLWKFAADEQSLWREVVREKYGMKGKWTTKPLAGIKRVAFLVIKRDGELSRRAYGGQFGKREIRDVLKTNPETSRRRR
nr:uncharacterized protein LOC104118792 [Nicotiana tomentosiformis]